MTRKERQSRIKTRREAMGDAIRKNGPIINSIVGMVIASAITAMATFMYTASQEIAAIQQQQHATSKVLKKRSNRLQRHLKRLRHMDRRQSQQIKHNESSIAVIKSKVREIESNNSG